jgi:signal transduction histidine kinase
MHGLLSERREVLKMSVETIRRGGYKDDRPDQVDNISLLHDHADEPKHPVALVTDVTERCRTKQELREAHAHLQLRNIELEQAVHEKTKELRQSQERLRALTSELILVEQRERKRLATELHDHLQQLLVLGKLEIGQGKRLASGVPGCEITLKRVDTVFSEALTYTRTLVAELSPPVLHDHGLAAGVKWLAEYMKKRFEQTVTVVVPDGQDLKLPDDHVILLFQSVRELLINSSKHAGTSEAMVRIEQCDDQLQIEVSDEGAGFDPAAVAAGTSSEGISSKFGLPSVLERMRALGGLFTIDSALGQGTTARLRVRLARSGKEANCIFRSPEPGMLA